jgi:hypothetical protein
MSQVQIIRNDIQEVGRFVEVECGKTAAYIWVSRLGYINVCCNNASHKAWRASKGRNFFSFDEAIAAYKSAEMKAIISAAAEA